MTSTDRNTSPDRSAGPASGPGPDTAKTTDAAARADPRTAPRAADTRADARTTPRAAEARTDAHATPRAAARLLAFARRPYWDRPDPAYRIRRWPDLTALLLATVFFWSSLTPSLVPRPWFLQGIVGGITAAIGYALGSTLAWLFRTLVRRRPSEKARTRCWQAYWLLSPVLAVWLISESARMQRQLRVLQGLPPTLTWHTPMIALIALGLLLAALLVARSVRLGAVTLIRLLGKLLPRPVAFAVGAALSALVVLVGVRDVVFDRGVVDLADRIAEATNDGTKDGIRRPASRHVTGGPGSLVPWQDLGYQGRNFTGSTPTRSALTAWTGRPAREPVRVYVPSALPAAFTDDRPFAAQARLAVRELERTGAFDRAVLAVAGTTGTGWIDPNVAEALEYMYGGDTAIVAVQYSYLPSWVSFLVDKEKAGQATRALLDAVRARLDTLPADRRPKLVVTGESLGAYAVEASFGTADALLAGTDGALLMGPPHFSPISREIRRDRDPGSPVWRPEYRGGAHIRFAQFPGTDLERPAADWERPRAVYLQNASDPVVWWSPELLLDRPEWLDEPLGPDVTPEIGWFPFVAFWQTSVDMTVSYGVDAPHGHRYGAGAVDGWAAVLPPPDWTAADTTRLRAFIRHRKAAY
ncbi:alpha/beta-hydrolase family protein [Streptomyces gardneri]|uniref:alpha/beta hydrolase n=1 Tax=Streptomyces gardneri TaxID=66892 RepID=UPI0006E21D50|nr:alpha/beta-hydrolase family protein [Streptomyces gardneri]QPK48839.1 alpha/beta-hydrolase family protein [Streptomyces gardneri]WRK40322.1 alpha/beta-hydrolase family protein [Streptomyces venezuelae]